jgi:hypothetical protein
MKTSVVPRLFLLGTTWPHGALNEVFPEVTHPSSIVSQICFQTICRMWVTFQEILTEIGLGFLLPRYERKWSEFVCHFKPHVFIRRCRCQNVQVWKTD